MESHLPTPSLQRICAECGQQFEWTRTRSRPPLVCSAECKKDRRARQFRESDDKKLAAVDRTAKCARCGAAFEQPATAGGRQAYCTKECARKARSENQGRNIREWADRVRASGASCAVEGCSKPPTSVPLNLGASPVCTPGSLMPTAVRGNGKFRELQHRVVMEEKLGRALLPGENVHHINGQRGDNRIENLELWSTAQPSGQRVADKVAWAIELLRLYKPEVLNE